MPLTPEALALRRKFLTGSDAKAVMDGDWPDLFARKTGRKPEPDLSDVFEVQLGVLTETFNLDWFEKVTGRKVTARGQWCQCIEYDWMGCTLDGMTTTERGEDAVVDAKHVGRADEAMVLRYTPQMVHNATVLGVDWWILSVIAGNKWQQPIVQRVDPFYQAELITRERDFWGFVERNEEPPDFAPVTAPKPQPTLRTVQLEDKWQSEWPNWGAEMVRLFEDAAGTYPAWAKHNIVKGEMKQLMPEDVGRVSRGLVTLSRDKGNAVRWSIKKVKDDE